MIFSVLESSAQELEHNWIYKEIQAYDLANRATLRWGLNIKSKIAILDPVLVP